MPLSNVNISLKQFQDISCGKFNAVERLHPEVCVWETCTPYFETRNIHFYVNRLGFHIIEFFNSHHRDPRDSDPCSSDSQEGHDGMFRFEKRMPPKRTP